MSTKPQRGKTVKIKPVSREWLENLATAGDLEAFLLWVEEDAPARPLALLGKAAFADTFSIMGISESEREVRRWWDDQKRSDNHWRELMIVELRPDVETKRYKKWEKAVA